MKYIVDVNGERITVDLDGVHATVDGVQFDVALTPIVGTPVRLVRVNEQVHRVLAQRDGARGSWVLDVDGERMQADALDERTRALRDLSVASRGATGPAPLIAPMPGLIVRVHAVAGEVVSAGQGLVVIEAMKMENELRATVAGVVISVRAVPGTAVEKGAILVELGPLPDSV